MVCGGNDGGINAHLTQFNELFGGRVISDGQKRGVGAGDGDNKRFKMCDMYNIFGVGFPAPTWVPRSKNKGFKCSPTLKNGSLTRYQRNHSPATNDLIKSFNQWLCKFFGLRWRKITYRKFSTMDLKDALNNALAIASDRRPGWWDPAVHARGWTVQDWIITDIEHETFPESDSYWAPVQGQCDVTLTLNHDALPDKIVEKTFEFSGTLLTHSGGIYEISSVDLPKPIDPDEEWS